jgi:hypothetical protein
VVHCHLPPQHTRLRVAAEGKLVDPCYQLQNTRVDLGVITIVAGRRGVSFGSIKAGTILSLSEIEGRDASAATGQLRGDCALWAHYQSARPQGHPPLRPLAPLPLRQPQLHPPEVIPLSLPRKQGGDRDTLQDEERIGGHIERKRCR